MGKSFERRRDARLRAVAVTKCPITNIMSTIDRVAKKEACLEVHPQDRPSREESYKTFALTAPATTTGPATAATTGAAATSTATAATATAH